MKKKPSRKASAVSASSPKKKGKVEDCREDGFYWGSGDADPVPGGFQVMPAKQKAMPTRTDFDHAYIPLDAMQRRARRGLLRQWAMTPDPFIAETLRWQENIEIPTREAVVAMYGKGAGWRDTMLVAAKHDPQAREELALWLGTVASNGNQDEFAAFGKAMSRVGFVDEMGAINRKRLVAILFVLRCWTEKQGLPTQAQVREVLKSAGFETEGDTRKNEARDFFTGPILGTLPKAKAGPKKSPSCRPKT